MATWLPGYLKLSYFTAVFAGCVAELLLGCMFSWLHGSTSMCMDA
jgi:hypothetical protein